MMPGKTSIFDRCHSPGSTPGSSPETPLGIFPGSSREAWRYFSGYLGLCVVCVGFLFVMGCERHDPKPPVEVESKPAADTMANYAKKTSEPLYMSPLTISEAPRPTGPLPDKASCITTQCHASYRSSAQLHEPVAKGQCKACHQPDEGNHTYPLKQEVNQSCRFCHPIGKTKSHVHEAIEKNKCTACHDPHASPSPYLLRYAKVSETCLTCHDLPPGKYKHDPYAQADCTVCHDPHESDNEWLLQQPDIQENCYACHEDIQLKIQNGATVHPPAAERCVTCHSPHATDQPHQLREPLTEQCLSCHEDIKKHLKESTVSHDAVFIKESCANCHDPHASGRPHILRDRVDRLCLKCHDKPVKTADGREIASMKKTLAKAFLHGPIRSGQCSTCHNVHGAKHTRLLRQTFSSAFYEDFDLKNYLLCFECHDPQLVLTPRTNSLTEFRQGNQNLHYLHVNRKVKGRSCKACHEIHGSNQPSHLVESVPFEGSGWSMPMRFKKLPNGGRCAPGCHKPQTYDRSKVDPLETTSGNSLLKQSKAVPKTGQP